MVPKYDAIIKSHPKDYDKIELVVRSMRFLNPQPEGIYLITPDGYVPDSLSQHEYFGAIKAIRDIDVFPNFEKGFYSYRSEWCFASLIAVFQDITPNEYYLDLQSDSFFVNDIHLFDETGRPKFFISPQHAHFYHPYFTYNYRMFGIEGRGGEELGITDKDSFIIDFMMYNKGLTREILKPFGGIKGYFSKSLEVVNKDCHPSDQDLYSSWCLHNYPDFYGISKPTDVQFNGRGHLDIWTKEEMELLIKQGESTPNLIAVSCHTWLST
jgi:hypothetical protein